MNFEDIPETIKCPDCSRICKHAAASGNDFYLSCTYRCRKCNRYIRREWDRVTIPDYPKKAKCPKCSRWAIAIECDEEGNGNRVIYSHRLLRTIHEFILERNDDGWGTYHGRAEIVRVYETRRDCIAVPE